jgi:hypothetical protein
MSAQANAPIRPRAQLHCEQLESRENPAGNVLAFVSNGSLFVAGDVFDNQVSTQIDSSGNLVVIGVNGTTVNGQALVRFGPFIPINVVIDGGAGNDQLDVGGIFVGNRLSISGGAGNDLVIVRGTSAEFMTVATHVGNDLLITNNSIARTGADFHGGLGFDVWSFNGFFAGAFALHDGFERIV